MTSSGNTWARSRGRLKIDAESGEPARREAPDDEHAQLVSHGARSEAVPHEQPSADAWLRHGSGDGGVWESVHAESSE